MPVILLLLITTTISFADFKRVTVQNLDLEYNAPDGVGTVEKVSIGLSLAPDPYALTIRRNENSFDILSPYFDFTWEDPWAFVHNLNKVKVVKTSVSLGGKEHTVESDSVLVIPADKRIYKASIVKGNCLGTYSGSFEARLLEDCRTQMDLTAKRIDLPVDFILYKILEDLNLPPSDEIDMPINDLVFNSRAGKLNLQMQVKYYVTSTFKANGFVQYENDHKIIAIRIDKVKFGWFDITNLVLKKLKELIKNPDVKVDPPWVRINITKNNEN